MQNWKIKNYHVFLLLTFIATCLYAPFLHNPIIFDDIYFFMTNTNVLSAYIDHPTPLIPRWYPYASIAITTKLIGPELIYLRAEALLFHIAVGYMVFLVLHAYFDLNLTPTTTTENQIQRFALIGAVLFTLHPVGTYASGYLIQRTIVLATLCSLISVYFLIKGLKNNDWPSFILSAIFCIMAVLAKENAVTLAILLPFIIWIDNKKKLLSEKAAFVSITCIAIITYVIYLKINLVGSAYEVDAQSTIAYNNLSNPRILSLITQAFLFFKYFLLWLIPNPAWMSIDIREPLAVNYSLKYITGTIAFILLGIFSFRLVLKRGSILLLGTSILFPIILYCTEFSVIRTQETFVLYRSYFWMPWIFLALPWLANIFSQNLQRLSLILVFIFMFFASYNRLDVLSHPLLTWYDAKILLNPVDKKLGDDRIYYNFGNELAKLEHYDEAIAEFKSAIEIRPDFAPYHTALGGMYLETSKDGAAIEEFTMAIALNPQESKSYYLRAKAYQNIGQKQLAIDDLDFVCRSGFFQACAKLNELDHFD